jgi:predicted double-glycine peptidase
MDKTALPYVSEALRKGMNRIGVDKGVGKLVSTGLADVPKTPRLFMKHRPAPERAAIGAQAGKSFVNTVADHPEIVPMQLIPGSSLFTPAYIAAKKKLFPTKLAYQFTKTAMVRPYQQQTQWTCSAACLKAVMNHYDIPIEELEAVQAIGTREGRGAEVDEIAAGARKLGLEAFDYSFDSLEQAKMILDLDIPIICDVQSFNFPGKGHYVVLVGILGNEALLMDPNTPGNQRVLTLEQLEECWWDRTMAPPHDVVPKWGVVVLPPKETDASP